MTDVENVCILTDDRITKCVCTYWWVDAERHKVKTIHFGQQCFVSWGLDKLIYGNKID